MKETRVVRPPAVAGMFYPASPNELRGQIADLLQRAGGKSIPGRIRGIIVPHAGYMYSGLTAAYAYAMLRGETYQTVVVVSPSHRDFFKGAAVYSGDAYETPLGCVEVDSSLREKLVAASKFVAASERGHTAEHALEVQLPFLQEVLPAFTVLPVVIGDQNPEVCFGIGQALAQVAGDENTLLVASTDLSHYYSADVAQKLDGVMLRDVESFDYAGLMEHLETRRTEACGGGPTVSVLFALHQLGVEKIKVLHYSNSGDAAGDYSSVVGYLSAIAFS